MSTLKVDTITKADGTGSLSVPAETGTVVTTASPSLGRRNLIINGAMQVAQRGTSATGQTASGYYVCDRFRSATSAEQTETHEQSTDAPDGFSSSYKVTITTADASIETNDYATIAQIIEAQNLQHLQYGTSDAKQLTVSFWVKSSATGTCAVAIYNYDSNSYISNSYTISSANTWEYKTLTFDGDISGILNNDNGAGLEVYFIYSAGSYYTSGTSNTWGTSTNFAVGQTVNLVSTLNATFQITGVQLEVGSVATPFEHRSYGEELALCQRYYQEFGRTGYMSCRGNGTTAVADALIPTSTVLRATPTITGGSWYATKGSGTTLYAGSGETYSVQSTSSQGVVVDISNIANMTDNMVAVIQVLSVTLDAEL